LHSVATVLKPSMVMSPTRKQQHAFTGIHLA